MRRPLFLYFHYKLIHNLQSMVFLFIFIYNYQKIIT